MSSDQHLNGGVEYGKVDRGAPNIVEDNECDDGNGEVVSGSDGKSNEHNDEVQGGAAHSGILDAVLHEKEEQEAGQHNTSSEEQEDQEYNSYATTTITTNFTRSSITLEEYDNHTVSSTVASVHRDERKEIGEEEDDGIPTTETSTFVSSQRQSAARSSSDDSGKNEKRMPVVEQEDEEEKKYGGSWNNRVEISTPNSPSAQSQRRRRIRFILWSMLFVVVAVAVGVFGALLFWRNQENSGVQAQPQNGGGKEDSEEEPLDKRGPRSTFEPTASPTMDETLALIQTVIVQAMADLDTDAAETTAASFQDSSSPASIVARWLAFDTDPDFVESPSQLIRRFVLGLLFERVDLLDVMATLNDTCEAHRKVPGRRGFLEIRCDGLDPIVLDVDMIHFGGTIPAELALFTKLESIMFDGTGFVGTVPAILGTALTKLASIQLWGNDLTGTIPSFPFLTDEFLVYSSNFTSLPNDGFPELKRLTVSRSKLSGELVLSSLGPKLTSLRLSFNYFQGTIPPNLCQKSPGLEFVDLSGNEFSGTIPEEIYDSCMRLTILLLFGNNLTGRPFSLSTANRNRNLEFLFVANNQLTGELGELGSITTVFPYLVVFEASDNLLSGPLSPQLSTIEVLKLSRNLLTGPVPMSYFTGATTQVELASNLLTGRIPVVNVTSLNRLDLSDNGLIGQLPPNLIPTRHVNDLRFVNVSHNALTGPLPPIWISARRPPGNTKLTLDVSFNQLSGTIPSEYGKLPYLQDLLLHNNRNLGGTLPSSLGELTPIELIDIRNTNITGDVSFLCGRVRRLRVTCGLVTCSCCQKCAQ